MPRNRFLHRDPFKLLGWVVGKSNLTGNTFAKRIWYDVKTQIWTQLKSNEEGIGFLVCTLLTFTFWIVDLEILQDILHIQ